MTRPLNLRFFVVLIGIMLVLLSFFVSAQDAEILLKVDLPERYRQIFPSESIVVESEIVILKTTNLEEIVDVLIEYKITDTQDKTITKLSETKGGTLRINDVKELRLPEGASAGTYQVKVKASFNGVTAEKSESFVIVAPPQAAPAPATINLIPLLIIIGVIITTFLILLYYQYLRFQKLEHKIRKISEKDLKREGLIR